jgi:hypothetical protein
LIAQEPGSFGKFHHQGLGGVGLWEREREEELKQFLKLFYLFKRGLAAQAGGHKRPRKPSRGYTLPVSIQPEFKEVGEDEIGKCAPIACELLACGHGLQVLASGSLGLDIAHDVLPSVPNAEVGVPGLGGLGEHGDVNSFEPCGVGVGGEEPLERPVTGLLPGIALKEGVRKPPHVASAKRYKAHNLPNTIAPSGSLNQVDLHFFRA